MPLYHKPGAHRYAFHRVFFESDVVIGLPKIKTHRKAGMTCAMKNLVGLNANKDWLPHHRKGAFVGGGDEYQHRSLRKAIMSKSWDWRWRLRSPLGQRVMLGVEHAIERTGAVYPFRDEFTEGSWWGNTTISRTIVDLNRAAIYSDISGRLRTEPQRRLLHLVDGIICGEGEGPMSATARRCDLLLWGDNALEVDLLVSRLIGFDANKIDTLRVASADSLFPVARRRPEDIRVRCNLTERPLRIDELRQHLSFDFRPPAGWKGHIELDGESQRA